MKAPGPSDRALRQLIANLATRPGSEIAQVLHRLTPNRRQRVQALLDEYHGGAKPEIAAGFSHWLAERLTASSTTMVTDHAVRALRRCAASLAGAGPAIDAGNPSLLSRLTSRKPPARAS